MAPRKTSTASGPRKRIRRTDEQLVLDLQEKIRQIQGRAEARRAKQSPPIRLSVRALRAIDKAAREAESAGNTELRHVLTGSREPLARYLETKGFRVDGSRRPGGRRPRSGSE